MRSLNIEVPKWAALVTGGIVSVIADWQGTGITAVVVWAAG